MSPIRLDCFLEIQTENLYQDRKSLSCPKLRNTTTITATTTTSTTTTTTTTTTTSTSTTTTTTTNTWSSRGGPRENRRSLSSPQLESWLKN